MGKITGNKSRQSLKGSGTLQDYFGAVEPKTPTQADLAAVSKMAPETTPEGPEGAALSRQDLLDLGADLKASFNSMLAQKISPIAKQLSDLASAL